MRFPRLKTYLTVFPLSDSCWGLRAGSDEFWRVKLTEAEAVRAFSALLPYLDGRTEAEELLRLLRDQGISRSTALSVLRSLESSALLEEADPCGLSPDEQVEHEDQIRFFSRFGVGGGARHQVALKDARIGLLGDGRLADSLARQLSAAGVGEVVILSARPERFRDLVAHETAAARQGTTFTMVDLNREEIWPEQAPEPPAILVVGQESHDPELLEAVDALSKRRNLPWLLVRALDPREAWVGPLFVPGETASYLSLEGRLRSNLRFYPEYLAFDTHVRATGEPAAPAGGLRAGFDLLASLATIELIKFLTGIQVPPLMGKFLTLNLWSWEASVHEVLRLPRLDRETPERPAVFPWKVVHHDRGATGSRRA